MDLIYWFQFLMFEQCAGEWVKDFFSYKFDSFVEGVKFKFVHD